MTKRNPVSDVQNIWFDAQQVDDSDLTLEQNYNNTITASIIDNHIGTGVLKEVLVQNILFDSSIAVGFLDGVAVQTQNQPSDNNLGNQLEIELINSAVGGKKNVKLCIIGLDFESNLQYEIFYFKVNEIQISHRHFTKILVILFNDFIGDPTLSLNLGGILTIREAQPFTLSRNPIMVSQDIEPNLFFRDFFVYNIASLQLLLTNALPFYNVETLNIFTQAVDEKILLNGDVTTQIGQKFIATTNNIQKVSLLLSVRNLDVGHVTDLVWNGDLIVSIYPLQSSVECPFDIAPNLAIDFSPSNIPIAQISINFSSLESDGIVLNSIPQPVDFIFSNSPIANGNILTIGKYYAVTIKRSGAANKCDILVTAGSNRINNSRMTIFTGTLWVDLPEQDLWFKIWTDAAKVSDGQAYDTGHGISLTKTIEDPINLITIDNSLSTNLSFTGNNVLRAIVSADIKKTVPVPDQRTGNPILSRQQFVPTIKLLNSIDLSNLQQASEPLIIGAIADKNRKFFDSISALINSKLYSASMIRDELIIRIIDDPTDTVRFDTSVSSLITNLLNGEFVGAQIIPNASDTTNIYRIASAKLASSILGDVNGDGIIDINDLTLLNSYLDFNLNIGLPTNSVITTDGYSTTAINGYNTYLKSFSNLFGATFQLVDPLTNLVVAAGTDGVLVANPTDPRLAQFTSASIAFNTIVGLSSYRLVILAPGIEENNGSFEIISLNSLTDVLTIRKIYLTGDVIMQILRSDIDGDFHITSSDGYLLQNYVDRHPLSYSLNNTFPGPSTNPFTKIGTRFNAIRLKLEKFIDRADDYSPVVINRSSVIHPTPDIFLSDGYFANHNFYTSPTSIIIQKQLTWDDSLIVTNSKSKAVPTIFTNNNSGVNKSCLIEGVNVHVYENKPDFISDNIDFYIPHNLIIDYGGELQRPDGNFYKVDFEVGTIILEIPDGLFGSERSINILDDFIVDYTGDGRTRLGFPSMKFADCSHVSSNALANDQIRFSVSVQSFSPNKTIITNSIADGKIGVSIDYQTGLLTLNFTNLYQDTILQTLNTKIQINVFLKNGGFNNQTLFVDSTKMHNMLNLVSVFSGALDGGPSALVDLQNDITGILPIIHGGTGLNDVGAFGTVLVSNGTGLSYQFVSDVPNTIPFSSGIADANKVPKTDGYGLLDPSFMYKNPVYIYGTAGIFSHDDIVPTVIGALQFKFDQYILEGLQSIKLEAIIETTNIANTAILQLFNVNTATYIGSSLSTSSTTATFVISSDLKTLLLSGTTNFIYEIHLSLSPSSVTEVAICKMARLVMTYNNPVNATPPLAHSSNFVSFLPSPTPS